MLEEMKKDLKKLELERDKINEKIYVLQDKINEEIKKKREINTYELVYIMAENSMAKDVAEIENKIKRIIKIDNIKKIEHIGMKKLAYEIKGNKEGYYVVFTFRSNIDSVESIEKELRMAGKIIKFICIKNNEEE